MSTCLWRLQQRHPGGLGGHCHLSGLLHSLAGDVSLRKFPFFGNSMSFIRQSFAIAIFSVCHSLSEGEAFGCLPGNRIVGGDVPQVDPTTATLLFLAQVPIHWKTITLYAGGTSTCVAAILANLSRLSPDLFTSFMLRKRAFISTWAQLADGADSRFDDDYRAVDKEASITGEPTK